MFSRARSTTITSGVVTRNAAGSALACLGHSQCMAAVTLQVGTPAAGHAENGDVVVTSPHYSTWLERVIWESGLVDMAQLAIVPAQAAWRVQISMLVFNHDGNLKDCMLLAAVAALRDTKLPTTVVDKNGLVHIQKDSHNARTSLLPAATNHNIPIPLTVGILQTHNDTILLVDPTLLEQDVCQSSCTVVVNAATKEICNVDFSGSIAISSQQLALVTQMALGRAQELTVLLE